MPEAEWRVSARKAEEQPVTCGRCGYSWDWRANQISRCPKCKIWLDVKSVKAHFEGKPDALALTLESFKDFQRDMQGEVGKLIRDSRRRE